MAIESSEWKVRISSIDSRGRVIAPEVLSVAQEISARALRHAEKLLGDPAIALSVFEESAATVSRVVSAQQRNNNGNIRNLHAYLFRAFLRRVNRLRRRELVFGEQSTNRVPRPPVSNLSRELELRLLVDELLTRCDAVTREMFYRRAEGFSWREIGGIYGISAHAAESRFSQALRRLRKKLYP
jgi:DNA-directed RNA polymerase specialized sigma24 family protein